MKTKLTPKEIKEFHEHNRWVKRIANGCENMRASKLISIPVSLPNCSETNNPCRFDICPKRKETRKK